MPTRTLAIACCLALGLWYAPAFGQQRDGEKSQNPESEVPSARDVPESESDPAGRLGSPGEHRARANAAQDPTAVEKKTGFQQFSLLPLPVLGVNPSTGFLFGLAPSANWLMGPEETTRRSSVVSSGLYTSKKQALFVIKSNVFLKDDKWNLLGDWRYFDTSQPTYGLGTGPQSRKLAAQDIEFDDGTITSGIDTDQMMEFKYVRVHQTVLRRVFRSSFYLGLGYHLDAHFDIDDQLLDLEADSPTITSHYGYSVQKDIDPTHYLLSGVSANALFDSRDNPINPYTGRYGLASIRYNPRFLGSTTENALLWLEYRDYFGLQKKHPRHLIAIWTFASIAVGRVPYLDLPALGWDQFGRSGRAYAQGRFRGHELLYAEVEYRFPIPIWDRLGGVVFANATTATNRANETYLFKYVDPGGGTGLRLLFNKRSRTNITLEYAWGRYGAHGFYMNANETF